jgi:hypothetical protein
MCATAINFGLFWQGMAGAAVGGVAAQDAALLAAGEAASRAAPDVHAAADAAGRRFRG